MWVIALWLVYVVTVVLPELPRPEAHNQAPLWAIMAVCFAGYGAVAWWYMHGRAEWLRIVLLIGSVAAIAFGLTLFISNELNARRTGDFEGYLVLMAVALVGYGLINILY